MRKILTRVSVVLVAGIVLLLLVSAFANHRKQSAIRHVSDTFVGDVLSGNATDSYGLFTASAKQDTSSTAWKAQVSKLHDLFFGGKSTYLRAVNASNTVIITYKIGQGNYVFTVVLTPAGKSWGVEQFTSSLSG